MGRPTEILSWRGVRTDRAPHLLEPGELATARNVLCDDGGYLTTRSGYDVILRLDSLRNLVLPVVLFNAAGCTWSDAETGDAGNAAVAQCPLAGCAAGQGPEQIVGAPDEALNRAIRIRQFLAGGPIPRFLGAGEYLTIAEYKDVLNALGAYYVVPGFAGAAAGPQYLGTSVADAAETKADLWTLLAQFTTTLRTPSSAVGSSIWRGPANGNGATVLAALQEAYANGPTLWTRYSAAVFGYVTGSGPYAASLYVLDRTFGDSGWSAAPAHSGQCWAKTFEDGQAHHNFGWTPEIPAAVGDWALIESRAAGDWMSWTPARYETTPPQSADGVPIGAWFGYRVWAGSLGSATPRVILLTWDFSAYDVGP